MFALPQFSTLFWNKYSSTYFIWIVLIRSWKNSHDGEDWCVRFIQDKALQEVQCQWLLSLWNEMSIHPWHFWDQLASNPTNLKDQTDSYQDQQHLDPSATGKGGGTHFKHSEFCAESFRWASGSKGRNENQKHLF